MYGQKKIWHAEHLQDFESEEHCNPQESSDCPNLIESSCVWATGQTDALGIQ